MGVVTDWSTPTTSRNQDRRGSLSQVTAQRQPRAAAGRPDAERTDAMTDELATPDPLYFQQASMLLLVFRFRGKRKLVASRLMESRDFVAELTAHAPVLERFYGAFHVSGVDIVSYQHGRFYTDAWSDGPAWLAQLQEPGAQRTVEAAG